MSGSERRLSKRVPGKLKISYIDEGDYLFSHTKDISADGMFIQTENPPQVGESVDLTFSIGKLKNVSIAAKVVWINALDSSKDSGMGVRFINPSKDLKESILDAVHRIAVTVNPDKK